MFIDRLFGTPRLCCPGCRAPFKDCCRTRASPRSVAGASWWRRRRN